MNFVHLAGYLGSDPEVRFTSSGQKVTTLRLATHTRKNANQDNTIWWRVTIWGDQFDKMIAYLKKGSAVIVIGELSKPEIFTDKEGKAQVSMSMTASNIMFSPFGKSERQNDVPVYQNNRQENPFTPSQGNPDTPGEEYVGFASGQQPFQKDNSMGSDDDIPF